MKGLASVKEVLFGGLEAAVATLIIFTVIFVAHLLVISPKNINRENLAASFWVALVCGTLFFWIGHYMGYRAGFEAGREHELDKQAQRLINESRFSEHGPRESMKTL